MRLVVLVLSFLHSYLNIFSGFLLKNDYHKESEICSLLLIITLSVQVAAPIMQFEFIFNYLKGFSSLDFFAYDICLLFLNTSCKFANMN
jgi:hypothetical protein